MKVLTIAALLCYTVLQLVFGQATPQWVGPHFFDKTVAPQALSAKFFNWAGTTPGNTIVW